MSDIKSNLEDDLGDRLRANNEPPLGDFDANSKVSDDSKDQANCTDPAGKKRFQNFRKMVNGLRTNKKEKPDAEKSTVNGDSPKSAKDYKLVNKNSGSTLSRMWNSLFPNKESPDVATMASIEENNVKDRSSKTLGRFFSPRNVQESIERDVMRPKSSTLSRKISQSFRHVKIAASSPNVCEDNPDSIPPTTSLEHENNTATPV